VPVPLSALGGCYRTRVRVLRVRCLTIVPRGIDNAKGVWHYVPMTKTFHIEHDGLAGTFTVSKIRIARNVGEFDIVEGMFTADDSDYRMKLNLSEAQISRKVGYHVSLLGLR